MLLNKVIAFCLLTAKTSETEAADRAEGEEGEVEQESWWRKKKKDFNR